MEEHTSRVTKFNGGAAAMILDYLKKQGVKPLNREKSLKLLERIIEGDEEARDEYIVRSQYLIRHIIKQVYCKPDEVEDLMMLGTETLISLLDKKLRAETIDTFTTYVFVSIKYRFISYLQAAYKKQTYSYNDFLTSDENGTFEDLLEDTTITDERNISKIDFQKAMKSLSDIEKAIIYHACLQKRTLSEVAKITKMKRVDIAFMKACAQKKLAKGLENYFDDDVVESKIDVNFLSWCLVSQYV